MATYVSAGIGTVGGTFNYTTASGEVFRQDIKVAITETTLVIPWQPKLLVLENNSLGWIKYGYATAVYFGKLDKETTSDANDGFSNVLTPETGQLITLYLIAELADSVLKVEAYPV